VSRNFVPLFMLAWMDCRCWKNKWFFVREPGAGFIQGVHFFHDQIGWEWGLSPSSVLVVTMGAMEMHRVFPREWLDPQLRLYAGLSGEPWKRGSEYQMIIASTCWVLADITFDLRSSDPRQWEVEETWTSCPGRPLTVTFVISTALPLVMLRGTDSCVWKNTWSLLRDPGAGFIQAVHFLHEEIVWEWGSSPPSELLVTTAGMVMSKHYPPQWLLPQLRLYAGLSAESWMRSSDLQMFVASTCWVLADVMFDLRSADPREWKVEESWTSGVGRPLTLSFVTGMGDVRQHLT